MGHDNPSLETKYETKFSRPNHIMSHQFTCSVKSKEPKKNTKAISTHMNSVHTVIMA
jgi:hypothetical protein